MINAQSVNSFSEEGIRENNEDFIVQTNDKYFVVCDGVGGHEHGEIASRIVAESISIYLKELPVVIEKQYVQFSLDYAIEQLNHKDIHNDNKGKMGTTVVLAILTKSSILVGHVGDSRLYHIRPNEGLIFRTKDHSQVQEWIDAEIISAAEAREHPKKNIITRSVHPHPVKPILFEIAELKNIQTGDYLFLCTDGIMDAMPDEDIMKIISNDTLTDEEKVDYIKNICAVNSKDNYSGILVKIETDIVVVPELINESLLHTTKCPVCKNSLDIRAKYCAICGTQVHFDKSNEYADNDSKVISSDLEINKFNPYLFNSKIDRQVYKFWNKHFYLILVLAFFCATIAGKVTVIINLIKHLNL
jgi:serine/threonine protein phosphatase PrpC